METIDYIYTGIVMFFSLGCIIYGIRLAMKTRKENIENYNVNKDRRNNDFENYETKH